MSSTTHTPGFDGPAIHTGQPGNMELVDTTMDNNSELLSAEPSNHSPLFPSTETVDTAPWIEVGGGAELLPLQFKGGERARGAGGGHRIRHTDWGFVNQLHGPRLQYPAEELPKRWGWSKVEAAGTEVWEALGPGF